MSLHLRWVGEADLDRVAETRVLCYAHSRKDLAEWRKYIHNQGRSRPGDYLLAERDGGAVGTATSPLSVMPSDDCGGLRFMSDTDKPAMDEARNRMIARGQCDIEKSKAHWDDYFERKATDGFIVVDPKPEGGLRGWMLYKHESVSGIEMLRVL